MAQIQLIVDKDGNILGGALNEAMLFPEVPMSKYQGELPRSEIVAGPGQIVCTIEIPREIEEQLASERKASVHYLSRVFQHYRVEFDGEQARLVSQSQDKA